jgi:hypothetical protein
MAPALLRGQLLQSRFAFLRQQAPGTVERVLGALPEEERLVLRGLQPDGWYPFRTLVRLDHAIADVLAGGDPRVFEELGRASARDRTELLGEHAPLVNVHAFLSRTVEAHRRFHNFGKAEYRRLSFTQGQIVYSDYEEVDPSYCLGGKGYLQGAVEMLSGGEARVVELTCQCREDRECRFDLAWQR